MAHFGPLVFLSLFVYFPFGEVVLRSLVLFIYSRFVESPFSFFSLSAEKVLDDERVPSHNTSRVHPLVCDVWWGG